MVCSVQIWIVSRADPGYPRRLKSRLREDAPPILYGCGMMLCSKMEVSPWLVRGMSMKLSHASYDEELGPRWLRAQEKRACGNFRRRGKRHRQGGTMHGALQAGGSVIKRCDDSLERAALARDNREPLMDQRLVFISAYDPAAGFNVGHAMQRNKTIYALADAALVVTSDFQKGGTWTGAIEQLERLRFVRNFVRNGSRAGRISNSTLLQRAPVFGGSPLQAAEDWAERWRRHRTRC